MIKPSPLCQSIAGVPIQIEMQGEASMRADAISWAKQIVHRFSIRIVSVFDAVSEIRPLYYLVAYLLCVPLFALVYWNLPGGFYAPYVKMEKSARNDIKVVAKVVEGAFQQHLTTLEMRRETFHNQISNPIDDWKIDAGGVYALSGVVEGNEIKMRFGGRLTNRAGDVVFAEIPIIVERYNIIYENRDDVYVRMDYDYKLLDEKRGQFRDYMQRYHVFRGMPIAQFSTNDRLMIARYIEGYGGDPNSISDSYLRMLYFSVVVITTVGFGDIVPMTTAARTWVAAEAIIGIILAGLFINAAASGAYKTRH